MSSGSSNSQKGVSFDAQSSQGTSSGGMLRISSSSLLPNGGHKLGKSVSTARIPKGKKNKNFKRHVLLTWCLSYSCYLDDIGMSQPRVGSSNVTPNAEDSYSGVTSTGSIPKKPRLRLSSSMSAPKLVWVYLEVQLCIPAESKQCIEWPKYENTKFVRFSRFWKSNKFETDQFKSCPIAVDSEIKIR